MSHVIDQRKQLLSRVNRIIGQLTALKRDVQSAQTDEQCRTIMQQLASVRGAMNGLLMLFVDEHARKHVACGGTRRERERAAEDLLAALRSFRS